MTANIIPGVGTLESTAHTPEQLAIIFQALQMRILNYDPTVDQFAYARVRVDYRQEGQPAWLINEDVVTLTAFEVADPYNLIRDRSNPPNGSDPATYVQTWTYTRVWEVQFTYYGPKGFDHARLTKSCMFQDFVHDTLAQSNLYLQADFDTVRRVPEQFQKQWWKRSEFRVRMNEFVTETLVQSTIASVEVIIQDEDGIVSDQTVTL
jgi:hypothetical protein